MGKMQRSKGARIEREIVNLHKEEGIEAERVPLSGALPGYKGDINIPFPDGTKKVAEVKARKQASGWRCVKQWLGTNDLLFLREDGITEPLVVLQWSTYKELMLK